jgi:NTE family protein/lysophospholipid hydrolase
MIEFLASLPLFHSLSESERQRLVSSVEPVELPAGEVLFRQGDPGNALYIVRSGTLQVSLTLPSGEQQALDTLGEGEVVGEMAVLHRRPRAATVHALTGCSLLRLSAQAIEALFAASPQAHSLLVDAASRRLPSLYLASVPIFAGLDADSLREFDLETNWVRLAGGEMLFRQGDPADYVYVVVRGRLAVVAADGTQHVRHLGHGDIVGEVAIFTGEARNATVRAVRDSELVRLSRASVHQFLERHPRGAIELIRMMARRVRPVASSPRDAPVSTIVLVPVGSRPIDRAWTTSLIQALRDTAGPTLHVDRQCLLEAFGDAGASLLDDAAARVRVTAWLHEQEERFAFVVFDCGDLPAAWADTLLRQADLVVFVAPPGARPEAGELDRRIVTGAIVSPSVPKVLVLLHESNTSHPTGTAAWLALLPVARHHHVRVDRANDFGRVGRYIAGKAIGLAVSGGGARTWAHVGTMRALGERNIPIDAIGGVSAGVFAASYCALGYDVDTMERIFLASMQDYKLRSDLTFPMASFLSGKKLVPVIRRLFGEGSIEDLWLPFFCLAANLTTARVVVLDRGPLWRAIRATTSVPGIHPPVCINGELLVDGGVLNNLPVDVMRRFCGGTVIASDVSLTSDLRSENRELVAASGWPLLWARMGPFAKHDPPFPHIFEILARTATLSSVYHGTQVANASDVYVRTPTDGVPTFDWAAGTVLVARARGLALAAMDQWQQSQEPHR